MQRSSHTCSVVRSFARLTTSCCCSCRHETRLAASQLFRRIRRNMATLHADAGSEQRASSAAAESTYREGDRETGKETGIATGKKGETEEHGGWQRDRHIHVLFGQCLWPRREKERERLEPVCGWKTFFVLATGKLPTAKVVDKLHTHTFAHTHIHMHACTCCLSVCLRI